MEEPDDVVSGMEGQISEVLLIDAERFERPRARLFAATVAASWFTVVFVEVVAYALGDLGLVMKVIPRAFSRLRRAFVERVWEKLTLEVSAGDVASSEGQTSSRLGVDMGSPESRRPPATGPLRRSHLVASDRTDRTDPWLPRQPAPNHLRRAEAPWSRAAQPPAQPAETQAEPRTACHVAYAAFCAGLCGSQGGPAALVAQPPSSVATRRLREWGDFVEVSLLEVSKLAVFELWHTERGLAAANRHRILGEIVSCKSGNTDSQLIAVNVFVAGISVRALCSCKTLGQIVLRCGSAAAHLHEDTWMSIARRSSRMSSPAPLGAQVPATSTKVSARRSRALDRSRSGWCGTTSTS